MKSVIIFLPLFFCVSGYLFPTRAEFNCLTSNKCKCAIGTTVGSITADCFRACRRSWKKCTGKKFSTLEEFDHEYQRLRPQVQKYVGFECLMDQKCRCLLTKPTLLKPATVKRTQCYRYCKQHWESCTATNFLKMEAEKDLFRLADYKKVDVKIACAESEMIEFCPGRNLGNYTTTKAKDEACLRGFKEWKSCVQRRNVMIEDKDPFKEFVTLSLLRGSGDHVAYCFMKSVNFCICRKQTELEKSMLKFNTNPCLNTCQKAMDDCLRSYDVAPEEVNSKFKAANIFEISIVADYVARMNQTSIKQRKP